MLPGQLRKIGPLVNLILQVLTLLFRIYQYVSCRGCGHACCSKCYPMLPALSRKRAAIGFNFKKIIGHVAGQALSQLTEEPPLWQDPGDG